MAIQFENNFERFEWLGREALKELKLLYPNTFKFEITYTEYKYETYDAFFIIYDKETHKLIKRVFIEIKYRQENYDTWMLEKKKVKQLKDKMKELSLFDGEFSHYYLVFTPKTTYMWDITNIQPEDCKDKLYANVATAISTSNKRNKFCKLLEIKEAKEFKYVLDEKRIESKWAESYVIPKIEKKIKEPGFNLNDILKGN